MVILAQNPTGCNCQSYCIKILKIGNNGKTLDGSQVFPYLCAQLTVSQ